MVTAHDIEDNAIAYYQVISQALGGRFHQDGQVVWFITGRRSLARFNAVLRSPAVPAEELAAAADLMLGQFLASNLPFFWVDWPLAPAPGLADYLAARGVDFERFTMPAMARSLEHLPPAPLPAGCEIVRVQSEEDRAGWLAVLMEGFAEPEAARADFAQVLAWSQAARQPVSEHFLARWQGEPCAISTLLHAGRGAGIYHVTTTLARRGRGLGKALTLAAMHAGRRAGYTDAILFATRHGYPLYQRMGFETIIRGDLYTWSGAEQQETE